MARSRRRIADRGGNDHHGGLMGVVIERVADAGLVGQGEVLGDSARHRLARRGMAGERHSRRADRQRP